jgi:hypothetical protein
VPVESRSIPLALGTAEEDDCTSSIPGHRRFATISGVTLGCLNEQGRFPS